MLYESEEYSLMTSALVDGVRPFHDAWRLVHTDKAHDATCGVFDHETWPQGAHCRDFFFVAGDCANQVTDFIVNTKTNA